MPSAVFVPAQLNDLSVDVAVGSPARGAVLYRGAAKWNALAAGTAGQLLTSGGAGADPAWTTLSSNFAGLSDVSVPGVAQGAVLYRGASAFNALAAGNNGDLLTSGGAGANPSWLPPAAANLTGAVILAPNSVNRNLIVPTADANKGLVLRGFSATQSANLLEIQKSDTTVLTSLSATGSLTVGSTDPNEAAITLNHKAAPSGLKLNNVFNGGGVLLMALPGDVLYLQNNNQSAPAFIQLAGIKDAATGNTIIATGMTWTFDLTSVLSTTRGSAANDHGQSAFAALPNGSLLANYMSFSAWRLASDALPLFAVNQTADLQFARLSSTSTMRATGGLISEFNSSTDASYTARLKLTATDFAGIREGLRVEASGSAPMIGFLGAAASPRITLPVAAVDAATTQALANALRSLAITFGFAA